VAALMPAPPITELSSRGRRVNDKLRVPAGNRAFKTVQQLFSACPALIATL
jgi:hypothetical protein